jgi:hypothetical protein
MKHVIILALLLIRGTSGYLFNKPDNVYLRFINTKQKSTDSLHKLMMREERSCDLITPILLSSTLITVFPHNIYAITSKDAIDALSGYHAQTPDWLAWTVLISIVYITQYRIFRFLSSF